MVWAGRAWEVRRTASQNSYTAGRYYLKRLRIVGGLARRDDHGGAPGTTPPLTTESTPEASNFTVTVGDFPICTTMDRPLVVLVRWAAGIA